MGKYLIKRLLHGIVSIVVVVGIVMVLIFSLLDRSGVFTNDPSYSKKSGNQRIVYEYQQWEKYGYVEFDEFNDYINAMVTEGRISEEDAAAAKDGLGLTPAEDTEITKEWVANFTEYFESKGYTVERLIGRMTSAGVITAATRQNLIAYRDLNLFTRLWDFFSGIITIDSIHYVEDDIEDRGIKFTFFDPLAGGKFSPAIIGNGTQHKYLLYFDSSFPFIHQNLVSFHIGKSYSMYQGADLVEQMTSNPGSAIIEEKLFPTGVRAETSQDLHTATYVYGTISAENQELFGDNYTKCETNSSGLSMISNSFVIGIIATILTYLLGVPLGIIMARKKDKLVDKIGTVYIVFIMAVPSLAYIFMFSAIGSNLFGLPNHFGLESNPKWLIYILPIVSLALPSIANIMKWLRRYMIDQMNSDYVKFARSGGLSEGEIFRKHILKNAAIPLVHGIPSSILGCITGAIITESVYAVPGTGKLLTNAINKHDNGIIVGLTMFYACLSVISLILGDILMALVDPRISFSTSGGKR